MTAGELGEVAEKAAKFLTEAVQEQSGPLLDSFSEVVCAAEDADKDPRFSVSLVISIRPNDREVEFAFGYSLKRKVTRVIDIPGGSESSGLDVAGKAGGLKNGVGFGE